VRSDIGRRCGNAAQPEYVAEQSEEQRGSDHANILPMTFPCTSVNRWSRP
jgi:hypothetical protein